MGFHHDEAEEEQVPFRLEGAAGADRHIVVTAAKRRWLDEHLARQWRRPPTAVESDRSVADFVREEVLYREALAAGGALAGRGPGRAGPAGEHRRGIRAVHRPAEIPADADVARLGQALAAGRRGDLGELMANTAAYSGLRQGELFALTTGQIDPAARVIDVDRKVIEVGGKLFLEAPKGRKRRSTIYPVRTPAGYPLAGQIAVRAGQARAERDADTTRSTASPRTAILRRTPADARDRRQRPHEPDATPRGASRGSGPRAGQGTGTEPAPGPPVTSYSAPEQPEPAGEADLLVLAGVAMPGIGDGPEAAGGGLGPV